MIRIGRPSPALVVAFVALAVALGGSAVALTGPLDKGGGGGALELHRVKANPLKQNDPCVSGATGVFCGYESISGLRGWMNLGGEFEPVTYAIDDEGVVHLQGTFEMAVPGGLATFILPKKYRPAGTLWFIAAYGQDNTCSGTSCDESTALLQITKDGHVDPVGGDGAGSNFGEGVSLDGITFAAR